MKIPLPNMMRHWREREFEQRLTAKRYRSGLKFWAFFARHPRLYGTATRLAMRVLGNFRWRRGRYRWLPLAGSWTAFRDFPAPEGATFQEMWADRRRGP